MKHFLFLVFTLSLVSTAVAETWYVEADDSVTYSTIQAAVDVAASGDTIRIGPGVYDEMQVMPYPGGEEYVVVKVTQEELTLLGAGADETFVGRDAEWTGGYQRCILAGGEFGNMNLTVEDLCIQNAY